MNNVEPTDLQLAALDTISNPDDTIVTVNFLRFKVHATYPLHTKFQSCSGKEAYQRYTERALPLIMELRAKPVWMAQPVLNLVAPTDEKWDEIVLVQWPTLHAFKKLMHDSRYHAISVHRVAALLDSRIIVAKTQYVEFGD